jgi:hypothetical protein
MLPLPVAVVLYLVCFALAAQVREGRSAPAERA